MVKETFENVEKIEKIVILIPLHTDINIS